MNGVRVVVGTRKGAFILTADGERRQWDVSGPHFGGWEIYGEKGPDTFPRKVGVLMACQKTYPAPFIRSARR